MPSVEGLPARRAALQMLDAVLRRGRTLDAAAQAGRDLKPADQALAVAIAGEVLRRMPDLDALIDGATRQRLPDDSKARMVLRVALAQKVALGTPEHALVATALPLVDGGPRRLPPLGVPYGDSPLRPRRCVMGESAGPARTAVAAVPIHGLGTGGARGRQIARGCRRITSPGSRHRLGRQPGAARSAEGRLLLPLAPHRRRHRRQ